MRPVRGGRGQATAEIGLAVLATTLQPGRDLRAGLVHVEHLRPLPLPVRHHRGGRGAGEPARSFTLTPMMSARLLRAEDAAGAHRDEAARSRRGFYGWLDRGYDAGSSASRCATGCVVALICRGRDRLRGSALPAGQAGVRARATSTRREFEVSVTGPRRHELRGHGRGDAARSKQELRAMPRRAPGARAPAAAASSAASTTATSTSASPRTRSARSRCRPLLRETLRRRPARRLPGQLPPARRDAGDARGGCASSRDLRVRGAQRPVVQHRRRQLRHRLRHPRAGPRDAGALRRELRERRSAARRHPRRRHDAAPRQARAARGDRPRRAPPTSASTRETSPPRCASWSAATRRSPASATPQLNEDYDVQLRLSRGDRDDPETIAAPLRPAATAAAGPARQPGRRSSRPRAASRIDRLDRQRQVEPARRRRARATRWPTASRSLRRGRREMNMPPAYIDARLGPRPRARAHFNEFIWAFAALDRLHVHDPGLAVREPDPPADDPALAAAVGAVRAALAVGYRQHAEPLLRARHPGAVRRGEEELDPPDRPHEQPARAGHGARADAIMQANRDRLRPDPDDDARAGRRHAAARARHRARAPKSGARSRSSSSAGSRCRCC